MTIEFVSVIMPAFNAEKYISSAIESVLSQTYKNFELIIVDDCSTDITVSVVNQFIGIDSRIKLIRLNQNSGGPALPRNIGIKNSRYSLIAFIDSDDIWHPKKLEFQCDLMSKKKILFCSSQAKYFSDDKKLTLDFIKDNYKLEKITFFKQLLINRLPTSSVMINKNLVLNQIEFNEDSHYVAREDMEYWLKCHELIKFSIKIKIPLVFYRIRNNQISENKFLMSYRFMRVLCLYKTKKGCALWPVAAPLLVIHLLAATSRRLFSKNM
jgi:teichuronic acid biosynthesis glycosyltransferase TuaG